MLKKERQNDRHDQITQLRAWEERVRVQIQDLETSRNLKITKTSQRSIIITA